MSKHKKASSSSKRTIVSDGEFDIDKYRDLDAEEETKSTQVEEPKKAKKFTKNKRS